MALNLDEISAEFLNTCGSCDAGLTAACTCSQRDYRPVMLDLVREARQTRALLVDVVDSLEHVGCQFDHCTGPTLQPVDMRTCHRCEVLERVRDLLEKAGVQA